MHSDNKILDDLSKLATGAAGAIQGARQEVEALVRQRVERILADLDLVQREEFEAVRDMARKAREENEALGKRVDELEKTLSSAKTTVAKKPAAKRAAPRKTAAKKAAPKK